MDITVCSITESCLYDGIRTINLRCIFALLRSCDLLNNEKNAKIPRYRTVPAVKMNKIQSIIYSINQRSILIKLRVENRKMRIVKITNPFNYCLNLNEMAFYRIFDNVTWGNYEDKVDI